MIRRLVALFAGLWLYGFSMAVMIRAAVGLDPWDVFHQGVTQHVPMSFGTVTILTGAVVLLAWIPLRQRPGFGTLSNVVLVGVSVDVGLWLLPEWESLPVRLGAMVLAVVLNALASVLYIGAGLGPGPRDGLMTGLVRRTGLSVRLVRTTIEVSVLATGWLLGGGVGLGTVVYAVAIGPLIQAMIPLVNGWLPGFATAGREPVRPSAEAAPGVN
ncbi:membrane protein YczE [Nocardia carnea]|uniref:YitT family protein n=1 Tax=Nocardia carnea TaxID=37328 RepID=A0ABW7TRA2_9NOCA|nr:membrane protein [Nocardia carnea]